MSDQIKTKLKYFSEKMSDIKKLKAEVILKEGQFADEFGPWMKSYMGGQEDFTLVELIEKTFEKMP